MRCDDFRAAFLAGDLGDMHFAHLSGCEACRAAQEDLATVGDVLNDPDVWQRPPPGLAEQVVAAVSPPAPAGRAVRWLRLAAAVVLVVAGIGLVVRALPEGADWEVELFATEQAPAASATVQGWNTAGGTRLAIAAAGLDPAPEGFVYELWFSAEDVHVSAGTFATVEDVTAWVGVRRGDFPRVWITLEELDDHPGPSPTTVLDTNRSRGAAPAPAPPPNWSASPAGSTR